MITQDLLNYIKQQKELGKNDDQISETLTQAGWDASDIKNALHSTNSGANVTISAVPNFNLHNDGSVSIGAEPMHPGQPLISPGKLISQAWSLGTSKFWDITRFTLLTTLCSIIIIILARINSPDSHIFITYIAPYAYVGIISHIIYAILTITLVVLTIRIEICQIFILRDFERKLSMSEAWNRSKKLTGKVIIAAILLYGLFIFGIVTLFILSAIWTVWFSFFVFVIALEGLKGTAALRKSKSYVKNRFWGIVGRYLLLFIPYVIILIPAIILAFLKLTGLQELYTAIITIVCTPFLLAYTYSLYISAADTASAKPKASGTWMIVTSILGYLLLIVIIVTSVLSLVAISRRNEQMRNRDSQRLTDVQNINDAIYLYYNDNKTFPTSLSDLAPKYLPTVPVSPTPADGICSPEDNQYIYQGASTGFVLQFCIGEAAGQFNPGINTLSQGNTTTATTNPTSPTTGAPLSSAHFNLTPLPSSSDTSN